MARFAIIQGGQVANIAEADSVFAQARGWIAAADTVAIGDLWDGSVFSKSPTPPLDRAALATKIDAAVIAIYDKPMMLSKEYEAREADAQSYKNAGYIGTVPPRVAGFATPAGMTPQAATDLILSQAAQLRGALSNLSDLRMQKYVVTRTDAAGAYVATDSAAQASADSTLSNIAAIAAQLG